jgi:hypothetical protein
MAYASTAEPKSPDRAAAYPDTDTAEISADSRAARNRMWDGAVGLPAALRSWSCRRRLVEPVAQGEAEAKEDVRPPSIARRRDPHGGGQRLDSGGGVLVPAIARSGQ